MSISKKEKILKQKTKGENGCRQRKQKLRLFEINAIKTDISWLHDTTSNILY